MNTKPIPAAFSRFLDEHRALPPRWRPTFIRVAAQLPMTATNKILKRTLRREKFLVDRLADPVYWRPRGAADFRPFTTDDLAVLRERFIKAGYADRLDE